MSKKNVIGWVVGIGWITFIVGYSTSEIGKLQTCATTWTAWNSWQLLVILFTPFLAGLLASKKEGN
jgi:hypothetical protein